MSKDSPKDICCVENSQTGVVLLVGDTEILFETDNLGIAHVGTVEEGA